MKQYFGVIVVLVGFIAGGVILSKNFKEKSVEAAREQDVARIQHDYLERVGWIRSIPDEKLYKDEVTTFFRWYFKEVNEHLNRFGGNKEFDGYLQELEERSAKGGRDTQLAEKKQYFEYTKGVFDQLRSGNYAPVFTASDKGMRLDVLRAKVVPVANEPRIRVELALWGAQREMRDDGKLKKMVTSASFNSTWKLLDAKGKLHGELNISGDPSMKIDWPERFIREFPPQMVLGHYDIELLPAEIAKIEITFNVSSRSPSGGEAYAAYSWKFDAPEEWKLKPGEQWKGAQEEMRAEEEIDPAKAAQSQR